MRFKSIGLGIILLWILPVYAQSSINAGAVENLKNLLAPMQTLQANFSQKICNDKQLTLQTLSGAVYLQRPGLLRWEVHKPESRLLVVDKTKIWNFDAELEQVVVKKVDKSGQLELLESQFTIKQIDAQNFELRPKDSNAPFQLIKVQFNKKILSGLSVLDQLGQNSIFSFKAVVLNKPIAAKMFIFTPPKGVDVVED